MARARNIKPGFFKNEDLAELDAFDRLLFIGLWCLADREGRIEDRPKRIKMELFPCDDYKVDVGIANLCSSGFIERFNVGDISVIEVTNFVKHQNPHGTEKDSLLPDSKGFYRVNSRRSNGCVTGDSRLVNVNPTLKNVDPQLDNALIHRFTDSPNPDSPKEDQETLFPSNVLEGELLADERSVKRISGEVFDGLQFHFPSPQLLKWKETYQRIGVESEIKKAAAWAAANPRKAKKNWARFMNTWLAKADLAAGPSEESCPVDKIIDLYHRECPSFSPVAVKDDKVLRGAIVERWLESEVHQQSPFWVGFFRKARNKASVFYRGENCIPRLEALMSRAIFREIEEAA